MKNIKRGVLSELPKREDGTILWKDMVGNSYKIIYDGEIHDLNIINIDYSYKNTARNHSRLFVTIDNLKEVHTIYKNGITDGKFGTILNKHFKDYRYDIGDIIEQSNGCNFKILNKTYNYRKKKNNKEDKIKSYTVECIDCKNIIKNVSENTLYNNTKNLSCRGCSDGVSYGEKFMFSVLSQLNIKFESQRKFDWSDNKYYDFYIEKDGFKIIIEVDGSQHTKDTAFGKVEDIKLNDIYKYNNAINNEIDRYIRIDAFYSDGEYIKKNILNSDMCEFFILDEIDWNKCMLDAVRKEFILLCKYWENVKHLKYYDAFDRLSQTFCYSKVTIPKLLLKGMKLGLCDYKPKRRSS